MKIAARRPGRPRAFDSDKVLHAATQVFWARGYAEASLDELTAAMAITRPSLYAAFGDKEALMLACITRYGAWVEDAVRGALADASRALQSLVRMYGDAIALYTLPAPEPRGCMLASACVSEATLSPALREAAREALARVEAILGDFFERAGASAKRADEKARLAASFLYGVSTRARLGTPAAVLLDDAKRFSALVSG